MSVAAKLAKNGNGKQEVERLSISKLAFRFDMDRATVRKRIAELGLEPIEERAKEKIYELTPRLDAVLSEVDTKLAAAKLQQVLAQARIAEIKANEMEGELLPTSEVVDITQRLIGGLYKDNVRMIRKWSARVTKMKTPAEAEKYMLAEYQRFAERLKVDFVSFLDKARQNK